MVSLPRPALIASSPGDAMKLSSPDVPNRTGIVPLANCSASKKLSASAPSGLPARRSTMRMSVPGRKMMPKSTALPDQAAVSEPAAPARMSSPPLPRNVLALPSPVSVSANAEPLALSMPTKASVPPYPLLPPVATLIETAAGAAE